MWESKKRNRKSHTPSSQTARAHSSSLSERVSDTHTVPPGIPHSRLDGPHELGDQPSWSTPSLALRCRTLPIVTLGSNRGDQASRQTARSAGDPTQLSASPHMPQRNPHSNPKLRLRSPPTLTSWTSRPGSRVSPAATSQTPGEHHIITDLATLDLALAIVPCGWVPAYLPAVSVRYLPNHSRIAP